jgi:hypothetical protein
MYFVLQVDASWLDLYATVACPASMSATMTVTASLPVGVAAACLAHQHFSSVLIAAFSFLDQS